MAVDTRILGLQSDIAQLQDRQYELITGVTKIGQRLDWLLVATLALGVGSMVLSFVVFVVVLARM